MSNNVFRKGLVGAALVGLAATAFAGTPAFAAALTLEPSAGTSYSTLVSSPFELSTLATPGTGLTTGHLDYLVSNPDGKTVTVTSATGNLSLFTSAGVSTTANAASVSSSATSFIVESLAATDAANNKLKLAVSGSASTSLTVTAWADTTTDHQFNSSVETQSTARTINFVKVAKPVVTLDAFQLGEHPVAHVTLDSAINTQQVLLSTITGVFTRGTNAADSAVVATLNTAKTGFDLTQAATAPVAGEYVKFVASINDNASSTVDADAVYATAPAAGSAASVAITGLANGKDTTFASDVTTVRAGVTSQSFTATFSKALAATSETAPLAAAQVVKVEINATSVDARTAVTVGSKTIAAGATTRTASYYTTTDANGAVVVPVTASGYAGDQVVVTVTSNTASKTETFNWAAATPSALKEVSAPLVSATRALAKGASATISYQVNDQFGQPYAGDSDYNYVVKTTTDDGYNSGVVADNVVTGGKATFTVTASSNPTGSSVSVSAQIAKRASSATSGTYTAFGTAVTSTFAIASAAAPTSITISDDQTGIAQAGVTLKAIDNRVDTSIAGLSATGSATVTGVVKQIDGSYAKYTPVTVSGAGVYFSTSATGANYVVANSITVNTDANGAYTVYVLSNVAGKVAITATAGAATKSSNLTFVDVAATTGKTLTVTAPATATPGSTVSVSAKLVDKYGNPVKVTSTDARFSLAVSGLGSGTTAVSTDSTGVATLAVTFAANETGTATITASYFAGTGTLAGTAYTADIVTATAKIAVAAPAAPVVPSAAKTALAVGADQAQVGAAVDVIATATDAAGKAVAGVVVTFDTVGAGYLSATTATTDANGVAKVKLVGNVAGRNTLTATAKGATAANAGVSFGAADANITVKGKRATVTYEFAGLAKVVVSVNGTRQPAVYPADDNEGTYSFNLKAGTNKIVVSIAGKTVDSKTVKIKK